MRNSIKKENKIMFGTYKKTVEVNSHEVIDIVRLLGHFGLKFEVSDEYCRATDPISNRKEWFRTFVIYGTRKQLAEFCNARQLVLKYLLH
jgi:hypothetical protein